jgi:hypothetical protein
MALKMKGEVCRCFMLSGLGYPHLILDLCEAGLCNLLDSDSLFFWLIHSSKFSHPPAGLISLYLFADRDNHRMGYGREDLTFSGLYVVGIPRQLSSL